jgi:hypothetical protein
MAANRYLAPYQAFTAKLDGRLASTDLSIVTTDAEGLQAPGLVMVERLDISGFVSGNVEICAFTGITGNTLTGVTRGLAGTTAVDHNSGVIVESYLSVGNWNDMIDLLLTEHETLTGVELWATHVKNLTVTGSSGSTGLRGDVVFGFAGNATGSAIGNVSGYPAVLINIGPYAGGLPPMSIAGGLASGTNLTPLLIVEEPYSLRSVSAVLRYPASGASLVLDINKNFTSIFNTGYQLTIPAGGTYASTASIANNVLLPGNLMSLDVDMVSQAGDLTVLLET